MGTNYYLVQQTPCECCGRPYEDLHIGKSSWGWCFALRVHPDLGIVDLDDWRKLWAGRRVRDEYGTDIPIEEMEQIIIDRRSTRGGPPTADWLRQNSAVPGPNGLIRHRIDGQHCIGHGEGTWDLIQGEFS